MAEAQRGAVDLDESRVDRRRDCRCRYVGGSHDLRDPVAIVERSDQQEPLRVSRKIVERAPRTHARGARGSGRMSGSASPEPVSSRIVAESSASASGFPAASRRIRSRTDGASSGASRYTMSRASRSLNGCSASSWIPAASNGESRPRAAQPPSRADRSPRRRATNASASADGRSSHWTSSATTRIGASAAASASSVSVARAIRNGSFGRSFAEAERGSQRRGLRFRQRVEPGQDWSKQLMEASEGQIRLRPDAGRSENSHPRVAGPARRLAPAAPTCRSPHRRGSRAPRRRSSPWRRRWRRSRALGPGRGSLRSQSPAHLCAPRKVHHPTVRHGRVIILPRDGRVQRSPGISSGWRRPARSRSRRRRPGGHPPRRARPPSPRRIRRGACACGAC